MGRDLCPRRDDGPCSDYTPLSYLGTIEDYSAYPYQDAIGNMATVEDRPVAHTDIIPDDQGEISGYMENTAILDICEASNGYGGNVGPENTAKHTLEPSLRETLPMTWAPGNEGVGMNQFFFPPYSTKPATVLASNFIINSVTRRRAPDSLPGAGYRHGVDVADRDTNDQAGDANVVQVDPAPVGTAPLHD